MLATFIVPSDNALLDPAWTSSLQAAVVGLLIDLVLLTPLAVFASTTGAEAPLPSAAGWIRFVAWRALVRLVVQLGWLAVLPGLLLAAATLFLEAALILEPGQNPLLASVKALGRRPVGVLVWIAAAVVGVLLLGGLLLPFFAFEDPETAISVGLGSRIGNALIAAGTVLVWSPTWAVLASLYAAPPLASDSPAAVDLREEAAANPFAAGG